MYAFDYCIIDSYNIINIAQYYSQITAKVGELNQTTTDLQKNPEPSRIWNKDSRIYSVQKPN